MPGTAEVPGTCIRVMRAPWLTRFLFPVGMLAVVTLFVARMPVVPLAQVFPTLTPSPSATAVPPTSTPTPTPVPTSTPTPTPTPVPTPTLIPTPTPGPLPDFAEVPILMYHYVEDLPPHADRIRRDLTVRPEMFEAQLQYLAQAGYQTITLTDLYLHLTEGRPLPEKPVILTFDDGYRDAYTVVFPLLQKYGFVGTFFVLATPADYGSPRYLDWGMMKEMADAGMEIQGHGRDHVDLRGRSYEFLVYQILGIKEAVEYHTGRPVRFFCYPSGHYDASVIAVVRSAGYWGAVTTAYGRIHTRENLYTLQRIRIRGSDTLESFIAKVEGR
ncbi:MAG: polysaccharide deacetylase family protein [Anaerolineae bacterium]|nr:polysaccharide deacetylase family protein [Anaerolineae bacterium]MDW8069137.1 polysaccharide deacetylase family protein [Anaerolineae bacterium]